MKDITGKRLIIAGGTGLLGRALASRLAADGAEVVVLTRDGERAPWREGVVLQSWDAQTSDRWGTLVNGAWAVVNLAGENLSRRRWSARRKSRLVESRQRAGAAIVQAIEESRQRPRVVVQGSCTGYYGACADRAVTEQNEAGEGFVARLCAEAEESSRGVEACGVRWIGIRTGMVLSAHGGMLPPMARRFRLGTGGWLGRGRQWWSWIHIEDAVAGIRFLLEQDKAGGAFNLTSFDPVRNRTFSRALARVVKRPALVPVPAGWLRLRLGERADLLLTGQRAVPRRLLEMGFRFRYPDPERALRDLLES